MDTIRIGLRTFNIVEQLSEDTFKLERKKKFYFLQQFPNNYEKFSKKLKAIKLFDMTGVRHPKLVTYDKKRCLIVTPYIEGKNVYELLKEGPLDENIYKEIFMMTYLAKCENIILDHHPINYIYSGDKLYYMATYSEKFVTERNYINNGIRYWFYTTEFIQLINAEGLKADKSRLKPEPEVNKEIVLMTCKYYQ